MRQLGINISQDSKTFNIPKGITDYAGVISGLIPVMTTKLVGPTGKREIVPLTEGQFNFNEAKSLHLTRMITGGKAFYVAEFQDARKGAPEIKASNEVPKEYAMNKVTEDYIKNFRADVEDDAEFIKHSAGKKIYDTVRNKTGAEYVGLNSALEMLGDQNFEGALAQLQKNTDPVSKYFAEKYANEPDKLAVMLTYKYGGKGMKKRNTINESSYS